MPDISGAVNTATNTATNAVNNVTSNIENTLKAAAMSKLTDLMGKLDCLHKVFLMQTRQV